MSLMILLYLASTKERSSALVGWSCTCVCFIVLLQSLFLFFVFCLHFMVYSVETVTEAF